MTTQSDPGEADYATGETWKFKPQFYLDLHRDACDALCEALQKNTRSDVR